MIMTPWLRTIQQTLSRKFSRGGATNRRSRRRVNTVAQTEFLEDRALLTTIYTVTNISDSGVGSLRQAIHDANVTTPGPDEIHFNIMAPSTFTFQPLTPYEAISEPLVIDGYTQLGSTANSATVGTNAQLLIQLSGDGPGTTATNGLTITSGNSIVRGLVVNKFSGVGIELLGGTTGNTITGNFIGTDRTASVAMPNGVGLSLRMNSNGNTIGGTLKRDRNVISANSSKGIEIGTSNNTVRGNLIGTNSTGTNSLGSQPFGVRITSFPSATAGDSPSFGRNNLIGGVTKDDGNTIAFNRTGVAIDKGTSAALDLSRNNQILGNSIFSNGLSTGLGIDLMPLNVLGVTVNDAGDADVGPNNLQNFPVLQPITHSGAIYSVNYDVPSLAANSTYPLRVEFFRADANGQEGKEFLGADVYLTPGSKSFSFPAGTAFLAGDKVVATATDELDAVGGVAVTGSTSEFSSAVEADPCTLIVTTTSDVGAGSLREAINCANSMPGLDTISFSIGTGLQTINVLSPLPTVTDKVIIDGTTQPGFNALTCVPIIQLNGSGAGLTANGLRINAGNSVVRGLVINRFSQSGIRLSVNGSNVVAGNYLGTSITGAADLGNVIHGVYIDNTTKNVIGGLNACDKNVISGNNSRGVLISGILATGNRVVGNFIGTAANGLLPLGNGFDGIATIGDGGSNFIGGNTNSSRNLISANGSDGIELGSSVNMVRMNFIGTDLNGNKGVAGMGNKGNGILIRLTSNTVHNNVISGNGGDGVEILATSLLPGNVLRGNLIGTNATGTVNAATAPNGNLGNGVEIIGSPGNQIGGGGLGAKNVISSNRLHGVHIIGAGATRNLVQGNHIGTDITGTAAIGNRIDGVGINGAPNNTIGGSLAGTGNLVAGNLGNGVEIFNTGATGNLVLGNHIGTDVSGVFALPNYRGVYVYNASSNRVGGTGTTDGNLISGNRYSGVFLRGAANSNVIEGNSIGTNVIGGALGNGGDGISVQGSNNRIGGLFVATAGTHTTPNTPDNAANVIAFNGGWGVSVNAGIQNSIRRNSIFSNAFSGINLISGGNITLAAPVCSVAAGMIVTVAAGVGRLEFFLADSSSSGEGAVFVTDVVKTSSTVTVPFSGLIPSGSVLVATFTDASGNTSRFSNPFTVLW